MVAFGFFAPKNWEVAGTYEWYFVILWLQVEWWGHLNSTCCNWNNLNFLYSDAPGVQNILLAPLFMRTRATWWNFDYLMFRQTMRGLSGTSKNYLRRMTISRLMVKMERKHHHNWTRPLLWITLRIYPLVRVTPNLICPNENQLVIGNNYWYFSKILTCPSGKMMWKFTCLTVKSTRDGRANEC